MLLSLAYIFIIGFLLGSIAKKLNLPPLIGYLICGILLGPHAFDLLSGDFIAISGDLKEIALLIILTQAGLSLELSDLKKLGMKAVFMSFVPACFEIFGTFMFAQYFFGMSAIDALLLGTIIASASPAVNVPRMIKLIKEGYGVKKGIPQLLLAGDSIDDVFNIVLFSSVLSLQSNNDVSLMSFLMIPVSIIIGIILGALIGYITSKILKKFVESVQVQVLLILSIGFVLLALENALDGIFPFSALISIIASGVTILKMLPRQAAEISDELSKLWVAAQVLLFAIVGAQVDISYVGKAGLLAIVMLIVVLLIRSIGILLCLAFSDFTWKEKLFCTLTGIPKATVQAALGGIPLAMGVASGEMILAISVVAILFTAPIGAILIDWLHPKLLTKDIPDEINVE